MEERALEPAAAVPREDFVHLLAEGHVGCEIDAGDVVCDDGAGGESSLPIQPGWLEAVRVAVSRSCPRRGAPHRN